MTKDQKITPGEPHWSPAGAETESLGEMFRQGRAFLARRWKGMIFFALLGAVLAGFLAVRIDDLYRGTTLLLVQPPANSPIEDDAVQAAAAHDAYVEGQIFIIGSTEVLRQVVERENLTEVPFFQRQPKSWVRTQINTLRAALIPAKPLETGPVDVEMSPQVAYAIRVLENNLQVRREGDSDIVRIDVSADRPRLAARLANTLTEVFIANREAAQLDNATRVAGWLDQRELELRQQLTAAEDAVAAFRIKNDLITGEPGVTLTEQQLTELNTGLIATRAELAERRAAYRRAQAVIATGGDVQSLPEVQASEIVVGLRTRLLDLEGREADLSGLGTASPRLKAVQQERERTLAQLDAEVARIVQVMANEVETLEARELLMQEELRKAGGETGAASRVSVELRELERRAEAYRALYERYLSNAGLAEESTSFLVSGFEVIDRAKVPENPFFPPTKVLVLVGLILGTVLGALLALAREAMLPGFMTAAQVDRILGLRVLSCVPKLGRRQDPFDVTSEEPLTAYSEAVRTLRHGLFAGGTPGPGRVVLMTSAVPNEGKTSLSAALAGSAYAAGQSVLVIDADLRRAGLSRLFDLQDDDGLCEILATSTWDFSHMQPGRADVNIIPVGQTTDTLSDLLTGPSIRAFVETARDHYDLIVIDGPPVANMADAGILADLADAVGFVIRWKHTPRDVVSEALKRLPDARVGAVLNGVNIAEVAQYGENYEQYVQTTIRRTPGGARVAA